MKLLITILSILIISATSYSETTYTWTGAVNSNFSTGGNWSPMRQVGLTSDILIFTSGANLNVINVNQVTIGKLIIKNNTNLTLSPATGNDKTIFINGSSDDDFVIEMGSSLNISANSPVLNINIKSGATAAISGILTFSGAGLNTLNAIDSLSIRFKSGSVLNQLCPGNIFSNSGINNAVVFENGSVLKINNTNAATPFGLPAPNSKVKFEHGSGLDLMCNCTNVLSFSGRTYSNFIVENNVNMSSAELYLAPVNMDSVTINTGGHMNFRNLNTTASKDFNIKGNLNIKGYLGFSDTAKAKNLTVNFCGSHMQAISGSGVIEFGSSIRLLSIMNETTLYRDLAVACPLSLVTILHLNGFHLTANGKLISSINLRQNFIYNNGNEDGNDLTPSSETKTESKIPVQTTANQPSAFSISQNYPNPFNPSTKIDYQLPASGKVSIKIFDINGREQSVLADNNQSAGSYTVQFDGSKLSSGVYFYTINFEGNGSHFTKTMKMILVK